MTKDNIIIMDDWNTVVREELEGKIMGQFGLGQWNARGEKMIDFYRERNLMVTNTWFKHDKRRRYTEQTLQIIKDIN